MLKDYLYLLLCVSFFTSTLALIVYIRINQTRVGYVISKLEADTNSLMEKKSMLELEISVLKRPERLTKIAQDTFQMHAPTFKQIIHLNP